MLRALLFLFALVSVGRADWPFPVRDGTTWKYQLSCEPGSTKLDFTRRISVADPHDPGTIRMEETDANGSTQATVLKLRDGAVLADQSTRATPQASVSEGVILPASLQPGTRWDYRGRIGNLEVELPLTVMGEEDVQVPAGKFRAWYIRGQRSGAVAITAEEWFVRGVGSVKESVTQRSPTGELLSRCTLELAAPVSTPNTAPSPGPPAAPFEASFSTSTGGSPMDVIPAEALQIVARWRLLQSTTSAKIRVVWIAEDTGGVVAPEYQIDEATTVAAAPEAVGTFTLSRPPDGWAPGKYRADFYVNEVRALSRRVIISAGATAR